MYGSHHSSITGVKRGQDPVENIPKTIQLCSTCFQEVSRGTPHPCIPDTRSKTRAVENLEILAKRRLPEKHRDQLCASLLDEKCSSSAGDPKMPVVLSTRGSTKRVFLKEVAQPKIFPAEALHSHQLDSGASGREMLKLGHLIRQNCGRKAVPAFFQKELAERANLMEDLYRHDILDFDVEKSSVKEQRPVVWGDAEELLENVVDRRDLIGNYSVKVMADGGQGFFKICMSIIPENYVSESLQEGGPSRKKSKILKCTSVHKLIMLGIVPRIKETYENLKILFDLTKINNISMKFVSDFKLLLLVNGQQTATSSFPCPYCFIKLQDLRDRKEIENIADDNSIANDHSDTDMTDDSLASKCYGDLRHDYDQFISLGGKKKNSVQSRSTINPPLFNESDDVRVIQKCVVPELHLLQGFVNHMFWRWLVPHLGREKALLWPQHLGLVSKNYHGEAFEGNACRKLLQESAKLLDPDFCRIVGADLSLFPFVAAFRAMDEIVKSTFSVTRLESDLNKHISSLKKALATLDVSETLKIHIILSHLQESLGCLDEEEGLGLWSEQAGESVHREFLKFWSRRKMNDMQAPNYGTRLKAAVVDFSSKHI